MAETPENMTRLDLISLKDQIRTWGRELGFQQVGITDTDLGTHEARLNAWLAAGFHADMEYMSHHGRKRSRPGELLPGAIRVISVRMDYLTGERDMHSSLDSDERAYVARYALGRDYHKVLRARLRKLELRINEHLTACGEPDQVARVFTDSAPVLEKALAEKAGLGWIGKNTLLLNESAGSWFFLGEIYTNLALPIDDTPAINRCGSCHACMDICPTDAIVAPYSLDSRRCISYHTIENRGVIPVHIRENMGNRVFGCDDCQIVCPWNRYAQPSAETDFSPRHHLDTATLLELFAWSEDDYLKRTAGSAIRRTGYQGWLRNIAIGLGNASPHPRILAALEARLGDASDLVSEHIRWAISKQAISRQAISKHPDSKHPDSKQREKQRTNQPDGFITKG
ncbi:MAG: tRNA epoxyqueuosine(34) reductase QueG [Proteobacteria bacterium]|nr:tRNA epoxyqueuosine(34) reductase QueG [Pseudomonadota bacterium]